MLLGGPATTSIPLPLPGQQTRSAGCPRMSIPDRVTKVRVERPCWDCQACEGMGARRAALGPQPSDGVKGSHTCTRASSRVGKHVHGHVFVCKLVRRDLRRGSRIACRGSLLGGGRNQGTERVHVLAPVVGVQTNKLALALLVWLLGKENQTQWRGSICPACLSPLLPQPRPSPVDRRAARPLTVLRGGRRPQGGG